MWVARSESCKDNADMTTHLNTSDSRYPASAGEILRRHENGEAEANITSAVRDFLILTGLAKSHEIIEENPPSEGSRKAVDLTALDTFIEFKRRIGTTGGFNPDPANVAQLDEYLELSQADGKGVRTGILTDGKHWLLRWPGAGEVKTGPPYGFTLQNPEGWLPLYEWLQDSALVSLEHIKPDRETIENHFGPASVRYQQDIAALKILYRRNAGLETVRVKRQLWFDLLRAALGEIASTQEELDSLFIRHTYLSAVVGMAVQASFGIDLRQLAESDPADLVSGRRLRASTGLQGVVESDFFSWPAEVGGVPVLQGLARRAARFDWLQALPTIASTIYESIIPAQERRDLGEYYTPDWLAWAMVQELITDSLHQRVLDPACGSGAFIAEAVAHFISTAQAAGWEPAETLHRLRVSVTGIDVHSVAAHLARSTWTLAARPAIEAAVEDGFNSPISIPVYLGDALQLRFRTGDMFAEHEVTIEVQDQQNTRLVFPVSLVERAEDFDVLMSNISDSIQQGDDPLLALNDSRITDPAERKTLSSTIAAMQRLHAQGRDHIWAYYTRNLVRPVALSRAKVDVIIGNPPWINYNQTADVLRAELETQSKDRYSIWTGGRYASNQDVAGLFFARCVDLYLGQRGIIGFVMPHSALQSGQYAKWRSGKWQSPPKGRGRNRISAFTLSVEFNYKMAWDLEQLEPNSFFPIASCVVFARSTGQSGIAAPLAGEVEQWQGPAGSKNVRRIRRGVVDTSVGAVSPYAVYSRQGAPVRPRRFFFVEETENPAIIQTGQTITVNPRLSSLDKKPWNELDLTVISTQTIEKNHLFDIHLGETVAPYVALEPLQALLPIKAGEAIPAEKDGPGGIHLGSLEQRMRRRWQTISELWENNKGEVSRLNLLESLDFHGKLSSQLEWQQNKDFRPARIVYTAAGEPTATVLQDDDALVDERLYWITCKDTTEADYLLAIINSDKLQEAVRPLMSKGLFGARDLHKHLWKLPIPEFDAGDALHREIAEAGEAAAAGAANELENLRLLLEQAGKPLTVTSARKRLRTWLKTSEEGRAVELAVGRLLA